jgi:hypothetical protein
MSTAEVPRAGATPAMDFVRRWLTVALAGALFMSIFDGILLQRARGFFTGGFLSIDHVRGPGETAVFLGLSLVADLAVIGLAAAVVMWLLCRVHVRTTACIVGGFLAGITPLVAVDFISYELAHYLGDAFDLELMFDLTGRNVNEILAVASSHLIAPGVLIAAGGGIAVGSVWVVNRYSTSLRSIRPTLSALGAPVLVALSGLILATAASATSDVMENGLRRKPSGRVLGLVAEAVSDIDRDGFGSGSRLSDPDPFDSSVFPYAPDIPGNGIDEDGVGGDLPGEMESYHEARVSTASWARTPDVVLVVLESFRADIVGSRADGKPVTPVLDALAIEGASSSHAYSHNGYTAQSRYHLFSGSLAGVRDGRTLVDDFKAHGYAVGYFSGQDESFGGPEYGVGFERADVAYDARSDAGQRYSTFTTAGSLAVPYSVVSRRVDDFLAAQNSGSPLFLYVNFHDTHFPYTHEGIETLTSAERLTRSDISPASRDALLAMYRNTAANVDRAIGDVLQAVRHKRGKAPAVIVTSDHGESLFDEGFLGHGYALNEVQTRIPLIAANLPLVIREPFGQRDLRDAIDEAMRMPASAPRVEPSDREVFQYLGTLDRPRQIAFLRMAGRTVYDFRSERVQVNGGSWVHPRNLTDAERPEFLRLIREWERMVLSRRDRPEND